MWSLPAGRVFGIRIRLHLLLLILFAVELFRAFQWHGWNGAWLGPTFIGILFGTILLHELGHCFMGRHEGGEADEILLWPLGGLAMVGGVPRRSRPQILTAAAGPAVNLGIGVVLAAVLWLGGRADSIPAALPLVGSGGFPYGWGWYLACYALAVNLSLLAFNLVPAFPLDGGKVLQWALVPRLGYSRATYVVTTIGYVFAFVLATLGFVLDTWLLVLALFIWVSCRWERAALEAEVGSPEGDLFGYDFSRGYTSLEREEKPRRPGFFARWRARRAARQQRTDDARERDVRRRVDELLAKISSGGMNALTEPEKAFLKEASKRFQP